MTTVTAMPIYGKTPFKNLHSNTVKPVLSDHSKKDQNLVFNANYHLMQVKNIAECILQYFWPSLSYQLPLRPLFCLFLSGHLRQVLL